MQADIEKFYKSVAQNPALLQKIAAGAQTPDQFIDQAVKVAGEQGITIQRAEASAWIDSQIAARKNGELSDVQLEAVAGGKGGVPGLPSMGGVLSSGPGVLGGASGGKPWPELGPLGGTVGPWMTSW
ncbi:hypothetical protein ACFPOE_05185 [Caenimonas terrae]|uniref:Nif11 family protein n=1 Tax=Caenimonas terrae TaxID=696074 RepID=A0ABW0ND12_9BURK